MNSERSLAIITKDYPYRKGEPYLHIELQILARHFKEVYIISRHSIQNETGFHFTLPSNVRVVNVAPKITLLSKFFTTLITMLTFRVPLKQIFAEGSLWYRFKFFILYEDGRIQLSRQLKKLPQSTGKPLHDFVWYSYWCDESAYALATLKKSGEIDCAFSRTHNFDVYEERHPHHYLPFRDFIHRNLNETWCISQHAVAYLRAKHPDLQQKFKLHRLGVSNQLPVTPKSRQPFVVVTISNIFPVKNLETVILALSKWSAQPLRWFHLGDGNDSNYVESIYSLAKRKLSSKPNIQYKFLGFIPSAMVIDKLRELNPHLLVNASYFEGIPVSMMEAASLGIPLIGPVVCGVPEIVFDGINGYKFNPSNAIELLELIEKVATMNDEDYQNLRTNSLQVQRDCFDEKLNYQSVTERLKDAGRE